MSTEPPPPPVGTTRRRALAVLAVSSLLVLDRLPAAMLAAAIPLTVRVPGGTYATGSTAIATLVAALRAPRMLVATAVGQP